ncbi:MAG: hypothetical protein K5696_12375 [Lachnospiraceae bacterium]|nr:hypothetical protein [Lachnospiraceae bacterium]
MNLRQSENALQILLADTPFAAGGARPEPIVTWTVAGRTLLLKSGVDYRLGYKNNKTLGSASLILTGQGNFTGKVTRPFMVTRGDLGELTLCAPDVLYKPDQKGTYYQSKVKLYDTDGKLLKLNTDYRLIFIDVTQEDMQLVKNLPKNLVKPEDEIIVQVWPGSSGRYEGDASTSYFIRQQMKDIGKPKAFKIPDQIYTGEPVMPVVRLDGLTEGEDYEMIGCFNNVERGSATVLLKGINAYSGNRTVRFRIVQRPLTSS